MAPKQSYPNRDYAVGQFLLTLRSRVRLTQAELANRLGIHRRTLQKWENGETYPTAENLRALIAVLFALNAFTPGQERAEAADLWQQVSESTPQQLPLFDTFWFDQLLSTSASQTPDSHQLLPHRSPPAPAAIEPSAEQPTRIGRNVGSGLPPQPTSFIGRGPELTEIARLLVDPACRLLTLLGPGGVGKTRLALEVAAGQTDAFGDGVVFVALASVITPDQIVSAIGEALQLSFAGQPDPAAYLLDELRPRHLLLILDNFEHVLAGADLVSAILAYAPQVTILITSRERLNLFAEWLFDVEGLAYPSSDTVVTVEYSAVQLFIQRVTQIRPELPLSEPTMAAVGRICRYAAGMPLAIELAAASARFSRISEIEQQIQSNLAALATTLRDVPARHRSIRAVFDQSWQLLSEVEQAVLRLKSECEI